MNRNAILFPKVPEIFIPDQKLICMPHEVRTHASPLRDRFFPLVASAVFGKPTLVIRKVRDDPLDASPESGTVMGFYKVD
jgi:hypothetical protein